MTPPPKYSVNGIFIDNENWGNYKVNHLDLDTHIVNEVERMLNCCNPKKGFFVGYCEKCKKEVIIHLRCNGRICNRCGRSYVERWMRKAKNKIFKERHRLVTLTVPADLRPILQNRWDLLKVLQDSAHEAIKKTVRKEVGKKVEVGVLIGLQTFGQAANFHPHLHCLVLDKAKYKEGFASFYRIPFDFLRKTWQDVLIKNLCRTRVSEEERGLIISMKEKYPDGFIVDPGKSSMNWQGVVKYLARYMRHPAVANSRIIFYGKDRITIRMRDKQKREYSIWMTAEEFIERLIQHIPSKNFKVIRWYGLYSRRNVRLERLESRGRQETISVFFSGNRGVVKCPDCGEKVECVFVPSEKPPDERILRGKMNYWLEEVAVANV